MTHRIIKFLKEETKKILFGLLFTLVMLIVVALLRSITVSTFLFSQIVFVSVLMLFMTYFWSISRWRNSHIRGNEIYLILFAFTITSFLLLNVDRSRSVYLLKWVDAAGTKGISSSELASKASANDLGITALEQRIAEQIETGNLKKDSKGYLRSTNQGKIFNLISKFTAGFLNLTGYTRA
jgi:thiol:disulfide interchange protein